MFSRTFLVKHSAMNSNFDEPTKEIQKFLVKHLELTPRRRLFEDYDKTASAEREEKANNNDFANHLVSESMNKFNLDIIRELNDFRQENHNECMSDFNQKRYRRAKEREEEMKKDYRFIFNDSILELFHNDMKRMKEKTEKQKKELTKCQKLEQQTMTYHYIPENSHVISSRSLNLDDLIISERLMNCQETRDEKQVEHLHFPVKTDLQKKL